MIVHLPPETRKRLEDIEHATGEPVLEQVHQAVEAWCLLPAKVAAALVEVEQAYGITRPQAVAACIAAGASEMTAGYVQRLLNDVYGRERRDT